MKRVAVLGSTGSVGGATLAVAGAFPDQFNVVALAAGSNLDRLRDQVRRHRPDVVSIASPDHARDLASEFPGLDVLSGCAGLEAIAGQTDADIVVVAVVGVVGLVPTMAAIESGKDIALADKEVLVVAGDLVMNSVRAAGVRLLPVDSELSALHRLLQGSPRDSISRLILTASGGPFRTWSEEAIRNAPVAAALDHPTWRMGPKITVDSATMMNKGFEIIEAHHLFDVPEDRIEVAIHAQSLIHAMVETVDGSINAQMAVNDMRLAVGCALAWPDLLAESVPRLDLTNLPALTFEEPDTTRFPALVLAREALRAGGEMPVVLNAANETAVAAFLDERCPFQAVAATVASVLESRAAHNRPLTGVEQVLAVDREARETAAEIIMKYNAPVPGSERRC